MKAPSLLARLALGALLGLAACRAVLGLEEPLDRESGTGGGGSGGSASTSSSAAQTGGGASAPAGTGGSSSAGEAGGAGGSLDTSPVTKGVMCGKDKLCPNLDCCFKGGTTPSCSGMLSCSMKDDFLASCDEPADCPASAACCGLTFLPGGNRIECRNNLKDCHRHVCQRDEDCSALGPEYVCGTSPLTREAPFRTCTK